MEFTILFAVVVLHELLFLIIMVTVLSILKTKKVPSVIATLGVVAVIGFTFYFVLHPPYKDISTSGQYEVGSTDYFVTEDETDSYLKKGRYREIPIRKYYPMNYLDENLPVIVVSDGVKESNLDNSYLCKEIASQGYVVLSVGAPGHDSKAVLSDGTKVRTNGEFKDELSLIDKHEDLKNSYVIYHKWMSKRMKDLNFVLDDYSSKNPETKFVVMGYYIGGSAAYGLARTREDVVAAIGLDAPFLYDITAYENNEFVFDSTDYTIPVMNIYSDSSFGRVMGKEEYTNNYLFWNSTNTIYTNVHYENVYYSQLNDRFHKTPIIAYVRDDGYPEVEYEEQLQIIRNDIVSFLEKLPQDEEVTDENESVTGENDGINENITEENVELNENIPQEAE